MRRAIVLIPLFWSCLRGRTIEQKNILNFGKFLTSTHLHSCIWMLAFCAGIVRPQHVHCAGRCLGGLSYDVLRTLFWASAQPPPPLHLHVGARIPCGHRVASRRIAVAIRVCVYVSICSHSLLLCRHSNSHNHFGSRDLFGASMLQTFLLGQ